MKATQFYSFAVHVSLLQEIAALLDYASLPQKDCKSFILKNSTFISSLYGTKITLMINEAELHGKIQMRLLLCIGWGLPEASPEKAMKIRRMFNKPANIN